MKSFADRIRESARQKSNVDLSAPMQKAGSITSQIQAQQTGKAGASTTTGQSGIAAQIAASQPDPNAGALQAAGEKMAAQEQTAALEQQAKQQRLDAEQAAIENKATQGALDLLSNLQASEKSLDAREDALQLEQAAASLRLQDKEYMNKLDLIAKEKQITNDVTFKEAASKELIGQDLAMTLERIGFNEDMARRERFTSFENMLQGMQEAAAIQQAQLNDQRKSMIIGAAAQAAKAGISYGADAGWFKNDASDFGDLEGTAGASKNLLGDNTGGTVIG